MVDFYIILGMLNRLTGIVGRASACAGIGCVGKDEAGKEIVVAVGEEVSKDAATELFVAPAEELTEAEVALPDAICCIFPRSKFWSK